MDATTVLPAARTGLSAVADRVAALVGSLPDTGAPIRPGTWTVREAAVHLTLEANHYLELTHGAQSPNPYTNKEDFNATVDALIADIPETDPRRLAGLMTDAARRLLDATEARSGDQPVDFYGMPFDLAKLICVDLGEWAVHGYDIAKATGRPWPIDPTHAQLVLFGCGPLFGLSLNPETTKGHTAAYGIELRGGEGLTIRFTDGRFSLEPAGSAPVDCVISADPVAFLLVGLGRMTQWEAIALGLLSAGGDHPELALGFLDLFAMP